MKIRGLLRPWNERFNRQTVWQTNVTPLRSNTSTSLEKSISEGLIVKTKSGNLIQNPLVGAANKAMADMVRYAAEFGLTPSARSRVACLGDGGTNPFPEHNEWF